jgi:hypothetical protein
MAANAFIRDVPTSSIKESCEVKKINSPALIGWLNNRVVLRRPIEKEILRALTVFALEIEDLWFVEIAIWFSR